MPSIDITLHSSWNVELTDEQASMLQRHVGAFRAADPESRSKIIQVSVDHMKSSWRQSVGFDRDHVEMVRVLLVLTTSCCSHISQFVRRYLYNRCRRERKRLKFQHRNWTFNDILVDAHQKEIDEMAVEMSGSRLGSAAYLGCYKKAVKIINERLDEETRVKYRAEAKKWTEQRPPHGQQQRYVYANHSIRWEVIESYQGCSRSTVSTQCGNFLSPCTANMECGLPFWGGTVMPMMNPQSCCTYNSLSTYSLTTYYLAMTSITSWAELPSKRVTKTGRGTQWSRTSRNGLPSPLVGAYFSPREVR